MATSRSQFKYFFIVSCFLAIIFPLVNIFFIFPTFRDISITKTEDEALRLARYLSSMVISDRHEMKDPSEFSAVVEDAAEKFHLEKLKVFSSKGVIVYSTSPEDVGHVNRKTYFRDVVAKGNVYTKFVRKDTETLEDRVVTADVVETYVPIMREGLFVGAFEIYYDITERNQILNRVVFRSSLISFALMFLFFLMLSFILFRGDRALYADDADEIPQSHQSPLYLLLILALSVFAAEAVVMIFISLLPPLSLGTEAMLDSALLIMLISPFLYFYAFRPLIRHITVRKQAERELQKAHDDLERRVTERTAELAEANVRLKEYIMEREKLEEQLRHAQKMEAIGTLTGGIAHEFNNILQTIIGCGEFLQKEVAKDNPLREFVDVIQTSAERASSLTQGLLAYSRRQIVHKQPASLRGIMKRVEDLLTRTIGENIVLNVESWAADITVMVDTGQIEQVIMNLATNARDAMPYGGVLTIRSEHADIGDTFIARHGFGERGRYAMITVSDTGTGMTKETIEKAFEPFFTTKEVGKGTGLGLSMVYGIVKRHNGYITIESEPDKGSTFRIYLPLLDTESAVELPQDVASTFVKGSETILLAEDDAAVRKGVKVMFENAGYAIIEAVDGEDAVRKFREHRDAVKLLILDVIMPEKDGVEAFREIRALDPAVKAIFVSGYMDRVVHEKEILREGLTIVPKPFSPLALLKKTREVLDAERTS